MCGFDNQVYLSVLAGNRCHPEMRKTGERVIMKGPFTKGIEKEKHTGSTTGASQPEGAKGGSICQFWSCH